MPSEDLIIKLLEAGAVIIAGLALLAMSIRGIFEARASGRSEEASRKSEEMEAQKDLKTLELMSKMFDQAEKRDQQATQRDLILTTISDEQKAIASHNTSEHERIMQVAETIADQLGALTTTTAQNVTEVQQTNRVLGDIMDTLNNPVPEPTTAQKLDQLLALLGDIKTEIVALKNEFTGRVVAVETDVKQAQEAIAELSGKAKTETQETETADLGKTAPGTVV